MPIDFLVPQALWLLAALPIVALGAWFSRTNFNPIQRRWQALVRGTLVTLLALAIARPVGPDASRRAVVYLVDVSHSVSSRALTDAAVSIDGFNQSTRPSRSRIVVFGRGVATLADTSALRKLADADPGDEQGPVNRDESDLATGLAAARDELPSGYAPHVVLFTDGHTSSDAAPAIAAFAAAGIPISVEPMAVRDLGDTWIDRLVLPSRLPAAARVPVTVTIGSQRTADVTVELRDQDQIVATGGVHVERGETSVAMSAAFATPGARTIEARLVAVNDPLAINNRLLQAAVVDAPPRVLYVEGAADHASFLRDALTEAGFAVDVQNPTALPTTASGLESWDAVVVSDVPRTAIPDQTMSALASWVEHDGGGVLFAGGEAVFGQGPLGQPTGYRHSELERLLPVTVERKDEPQLALILVFDKSWSMEGEVIELCKQAAEAAVDVMTDQHIVGVVTFDGESRWNTTPRTVGPNRTAIREAIAGIQASGATYLYPALEMAYNALRDINARTKHVILMSDGFTQQADHQGLVAKMTAARITVSSVAVGSAADKVLLANIARWGGGRSYSLPDARQVQQIFVQEAKDAASAFDEGADIAPVVSTRAFLEPVDLSKMPPLHGRTGMTLKDGATQVLATKEGSPLLAYWAVGAGRTAAFASDVKDCWADAWIRWPAYGPLFAATVRSIARQRPPALTLSVVTTGVRGGVRSLAASVEARDGQGRYRDLLRPVLHARTGAGKASELRMSQSAPGRYEGTLLVDARDSAMITATSADLPDRPTRLVMPDLQAEYRLRPADLGLLKDIAATTGGSFQPSAADLTRTRAAETTRRELWPLLVAVALALWMADILLRRVRIGEIEQ